MIPVSYRQDLTRTPRIDEPVPSGLDANLIAWGFGRLSRMNHNRKEAALARFTIGFLAIYVPVETWYSFPELWDPFYLVDFIGIVLIASGLVRGRRDHSWRGLPVLIAGYAWTGANFWRALFDRVLEVADGSELEYGSLELCFTACVMIAALAGLGWSVVLLNKQRASG